MMQDIHYVAADKAITDRFGLYEKPNRWLLRTLLVVAIISVIVAIAGGWLAFSGKEDILPDKNTTSLNAR